MADYGGASRAGRRGYSPEDVERIEETRPVFDTFSMRLPREEANRMRRFKGANRLSVGEFVIYLMNCAGVPADGDERRAIDYAKLGPTGE